MTKKQTNWMAKLSGGEFKVCRLQDAPTRELETLDTAQSVVNYLRPMLPQSIAYRPDTENLIVVHLNTRKKPIGWEVVSNGTLDTLLVHPREVFKSAIIANAAAIVVCHNHPSGDATPSEADIKVTRDLMRAGQLMKIELIDHIVLGESVNGKKDFSSLRELGYFYA